MDKSYIGDKPPINLLNGGIEMITTKILKFSEAELKFHCGKYISSIEPTTGVGNERDIGFLAEYVWSSGFDPDIIEYEHEHPDEEITEWECHKMYYGLIITDDGFYQKDPKQLFSVIWSDWAGGTYSIIKSPYVQFCEPCSPCCPGQVSLGQSGKYLGFSPSIVNLDEAEWKDYYETELPEVWVYDLEYEIHQTELEIADVKKWKEIYKAVDSIKQIERIEILSAYLEALSSALAANQKNTEQRILVKQQRIE